METMVATALLATAIVTLAQLFGLSTRSNVGSRTTTYAAVLAQQKLEELRALSWGFDSQGVAVSDLTTDTAATPETPGGGTGLSPAPDTSLQQNTAGWVDFVDQFGAKLGGGASPPRNAIYTRRWMVQPLPADPDNTLVLQVMVTRRRDRSAADAGAVRRLPEEARLVTMKTRRAR